MSRTERVWAHFDSAFRHADDAFKEADKAFAEAEQVYHDLPRSAAYKPGCHTLKFESRSAGERWRLAKKFLMLCLSVTFTGKARLRFKDR